MKKVLLNGANGRMGKVLQRMIAESPELEVAAGVDPHSEEATAFPLYKSLAEVKETVDVVVDYSHYAGVPALIDYCVAQQVPLVVATTGLDEATKAKLQEAAKTIPVFQSANMSLGINVLIKALQAVSPYLEADFNIEIIEKHHNQKKDAPSGTALLLADGINDVLAEKKDYIYGRSGNDNENKMSEMGIHAVRGGTIPGEHTVLFAGQDELIEFKHTALSRDIFASGTLKAANFLLKQGAGFYNMQDLLAE